MYHLPLSHHRCRGTFLPWEFDRILSYAGTSRELQDMAFLAQCFPRNVRSWVDPVPASIFHKWYARLIAAPCLETQEATLNRHHQAPCLKWFYTFHRLILIPLVSLQGATKTMGCSVRIQRATKERLRRCLDKKAHLSRGILFFVSRVNRMDLGALWSIFHEFVMNYAVSLGSCRAEFVLQFYTSGIYFRKFSWKFSWNLFKF